jgi:hypothetical protein
MKKQRLRRIILKILTLGPVPPIAGNPGVRKNSQISKTEKETYQVCQPFLLIRRVVKSLNYENRQKSLSGNPSGP